MQLLSPSKGCKTFDLTKMNIHLISSVDPIVKPVFGVHMTYLWQSRRNGEDNHTCLGNGNILK